MLRALIVAALAAGFLQGCGAVVVGGIALGAAVMHDRRDDETVLQDQNIELQAMQIVNDNPDIKQGCRIAPTSYNLVVLLTGQCAEQELTNSLAEKVSRLAKVRRVVDEITIGPLASLTQESADVLITSRATFAISEVDIDDFDATRVKVVTEQGVVYLMGLLTPDEADAVVEKVRYVSGVKKVIKVFEYIQPTTETG
jgi:osmotically-inducible protein OsmY